jgi:uridylate kinase
VPDPAQRVVLKLSGEALAGPDGFGIDVSTVRRLATELVQAQSEGLEIGLVVGGGNLFRGAALANGGLQRVTGDHMGMLATVMNALAMRDLLQSLGGAATVLSAVPIGNLVEAFSQRRAVSLLDAGQLVLFAGGTGNPFFTTDTAACLRAIEVDADLVLKATKVDGVYDRDPHRYPAAQRYDNLSYDEVIRRGLAVMDMTAICLCRDHRMPLIVFDMDTPGALRQIAAGDAVGTLVDEYGEQDG